MSIKVIDKKGVYRMKLSSNSIAILKNLSKVNGGVVLKPGQAQRTISPDNKDVLVEATLEDSFPHEFGIYNLDQFLGNLTSLKSPELTFSKDYVLLDDGDVKMRFHGCPTNLIVVPKDTGLTLDKLAAKFTLTKEMQKKLTNLANTNGFDCFSVTGKSGILSLKVHEKGNDTSNFAQMESVGNFTGNDFESSFSIKNLQLLMDDRDYEVELQEDSFGRFVSLDKKLEYYIAMENES